MTSPRISIISPVYKDAEHLEEMIKTVLDQTRRNWELVLIDGDCSAESAAIAERFARAHAGQIRYLEKPVSPDRNRMQTCLRGVEEVRADVMAFVEPGAIWAREYLDKHLEIWEAKQNENVFLSYGPCCFRPVDALDGSSDIVQPMPPGVPKVFSPGALLNWYFDSGYQSSPVPSTVFVRREAFSKVRHLENLKIDGPEFEDRFLWWSMALHFPVRVHGHCWVRRRHRVTTDRATYSTSGSFRAEVDFLKAFADELAKHQPEHDLLRSEKLSLRAQHLQSQTSRKKALRGVVRMVLPRSVRQAVRQVWTNIKSAQTRRRLGVNVQPLSETFGADRGLPVLRYYAEQFLQEFSTDIQGHCLEFNDSLYTRAFGGSSVTQMDVVHIDDSNVQATIVADLTKPNEVPSNHFDCIICTFTLHLVFEADIMIREMHRILKPGGSLLVVTPHISMCETRWHEFWRFTPEGLLLTLAKVFAKDLISIRAYGNSLTAAGQIRGLAAEDFTEKELNHHDPRFAVIACARARKKMAQPMQESP
jgi:glycosyltransferase involved in cell wall biosynthesis/SAM-dependent methyltransferase